MRGTVAEVVIDRGFGFIDGESGQRFFFHRSGLQGTDFEELGAGTAVEFEIGSDTSGDQPGEHARAVNVRLAPEAMPAADHEVLPAQKTS
jgi:cold shock CspA family protein